MSNITDGFQKNVLVKINDMKKWNAIIITVCVAITIVNVILLWISHTQTIADINIETYIGIIATLIGVCATIIVGFQIAHFIEMRALKEQIDELNKLRSDINQKSVDLEKNLAFVKVGVSSAFRVFYRKFKDDPLAPVACIIAIIAYDTTDKAQASKTLLGNYQKLYKMLSAPTCNTKLARNYLDDLKQVCIPKELKDHDEICRLHYNIIQMLQKG